MARANSPIFSLRLTEENFQDLRIFCGSNAYWNRNYFINHLIQFFFESLSRKEREKVLEWNHYGKPKYILVEDGE